jgi:RNA polymerase sigma factor (sigma-70 family)
MARLAAELERIYRLHRQQLFTCALAVTRCRDLAEDAVHEAFCRLIRLERKPRDLKVYVFRAVRNAALDQLRRRSPSLVAEVDEPIFEREGASGDPVVAAEMQSHLKRALSSLAEREREIIVQHVYGELTFREIARIRGIPAGTAAAWYYKGLKRLEAKLRESTWKS